MSYPLDRLLTQEAAKRADTLQRLSRMLAAEPGHAPALAPQAVERGSELSARPALTTRALAMAKQELEPTLA